MCLVVLLSMAVFMAKPGESTFWNILPAIGVAIAWLILVWVTPFSSARRQFRNTPSAQNPITIEATDSGLHFRSPYTDSRVTWSAYVGWQEWKTVFVVLPQPRIYCPIPKRAFTADQLDEFREMLRQNIVPQQK